MKYIDIENDVLEKLEALVDGDIVRSVNSYGGEFSPDSFGQTSIQTPSIYAHVSGLQNDPQGDVDMRSYSVTVYAVDRNLRGESDTRHGVYEICDAVRSALNRASICGAGTLELNRETLVGYSRAINVCVMQIDFTLPLDEPIIVI